LKTLANAPTIYMRVSQENIKHMVGPNLLADKRFKFNSLYQKTACASNLKAQIDRAAWPPTAFD